MTFVNNLKLGVDLPPAQQLRFLPASTIATSALCTADTTNDRYIYYLSGATFYRYDRIANTFQQLQSPNTAAATAATLRYTACGGYRGNVLDASANTLTIAGCGQGTTVGQKIRITAGTGAGQERTILSTSDNNIQDHGVVTAAAAASITDSTKKWQINEWVGYQVRIVFGTGQSQIRKVLYNDATNLYFYDANYQQLEAWNNAVFSAIAPLALPAATAGAQAHYTIEQTVITVDSVWAVTPDDSSSYVLLSGGVWFVTASATAPWMILQYYCVLSDTWITKTSLGGHLLAALGTDFSIERTSEVGGVFASGTATSGTARTLTDTSKSMSIDSYCNFQIRITGGTGAGQRRRIVANGTNYFETEKPWDVTPDATSTYALYSNTEEVTLCGNGAAALYKINVEIDAWYQGQLIDYGTARNAAVSYKGQEAFGLTSATRNTGGITAVNSTPTAGGTGYAVGDTCNVTTGGTNGKIRVTAVTAGVVTAIELYACGSGYTTGTGKATTNIIGSGSGLTIEITTIGTVGRLVTATNHNICKGDQFTISGITEALWDATYTAVGVDGLTGIDIITTATATGVITNSQSTTVLVDSTKNWAVNEHVGKLVSINIAGTSPTTQIKRITANTATTLTLQSAITAAVTGTSRYTIYNPEAFGRDEQYRVATKNGRGRASGGSTTTLTDSSKNWNSNQWSGYKIRIVAGTGVGSEFTITSNTTTTLTYTTQSFTPDATTKYLIMDTFGLATAGTTTTLTDSTKNWTVNQWAGKRVKITSGTGAGQELTITSNTATVLTFATATAPSTDSTYTILGMPPRSTGVSINWIFGSSVDPGKYMALPRGGATNVVDRYDIINDLVEYALVITPRSETLTTGTMYTYDGGDYLYCHVAGTQRIIRVNVLTGKIDGVGMLPYPHGTAVIGSRMEFIEIEPKTESSTGFGYIYIALHSRSEFFRLPVYW